MANQESITHWFYCRGEAKEDIYQDKEKMVKLGYKVVDAKRRGDHVGIIFVKVRTETNSVRQPFF